MSTLATLCLLISSVIIAYHHVIYTWVLRWKVSHGAVFSDRQGDSKATKKPSIGIFIAAYNEASFIADKLHNIACQTYSEKRIGIHLATDGCQDNTADIARSVLAKINNEFIRFTLDEYTHNRGKIAVMNGLIEKYKHHYDIIVFTDASALLSINALDEIALQMESHKVVATSGRYLPMPEENQNIEKYWTYQNQIRALEGAIGSVNGLPGAMLAIRSSAVNKLETDTINDDFVQVVQAVKKDQNVCFNKNISIIECEPDDVSKDLARRLRIGAGNWQQISYILNGITEFSPAQIFCFLSNKVLRGVMPLVFILFYFSLFVLAIEGHTLAVTSFIGLVTIHLVGVLKLCCSIKRQVPIIDSVNYVVASYLACALGIVTSSRYKRWTRATGFSLRIMAIKVFKRCIDILFAILGILLSSPIMLMAGLAIKCDSKGAVFFSQLRVGKIDHRKADLIYIYKLRTMYENAESDTGAVWAKNNDPRITRVGRWLRKTRIDELPQLWNVLKGDMSLIGPRPERPNFYQNLERDIPFFVQRTFKVRPGITGLAQVMNGYDRNVEDVRQKIAWDYAYALSMSSFAAWLKVELDIVYKTVQVVVRGDGQ